MNKEVIPIKEIIDFDSRSEEFFPIEWYKHMLTNHPLYFEEKTRTWNTFKYDHVKEVLSNYEYFSSEGPRTTIFVGANSESDGAQLRQVATEYNVTMFTSLDTVKALLDVLEETTLTISTIDA